MNQFVIPQFIDVEDKIIGPITTRQFLILLVGGLLLFLEFKLADFTLFLLEGILTIVFFGGFAFLKVNGMPFHFFVINIIQTFKRPRLRIWHKAINPKELSASADSRGVGLHNITARPHVSLSHSRLQELTLVVDTGGVYQAEDEFLNQKNMITK
ncbi:MAG: PrgI family protein [Patescibacteria group bacterium]